MGSVQAEPTECCLYPETVVLLWSRTQDTNLLPLPGGQLEGEEPCGRCLASQWVACGPLWTSPWPASA